MLFLILDLILFHSHYADVGLWMNQYWCNEKMKFYEKNTQEIALNRESKNGDHFICLHVENNLLFFFYFSFLPFKASGIFYLLVPFWTFNISLPSTRKRRERNEPECEHIMKMNGIKNFKNRSLFQWLIKNGNDNQWKKKKKNWEMKWLALI